MAPSLILDRGSCDPCATLHNLTALLGQDRNFNDVLQVFSVHLRLPVPWMCRGKCAMCRAVSANGHIWYSQAGASLVIRYQDRKADGQSVTGMDFRFLHALAVKPGAVF